MENHLFFQLCQQKVDLAHFTRKKKIHFLLSAFHIVCYGNSSKGGGAYDFLYTHLSGEEGGAS